MDERNTKTGLLYISLHRQLERNSGFNRIITRDKIFTIIGKHYLIPKGLRDTVIKEMERRNLIRFESRNIIQVLPCDIDSDSDACRFYQVVGVEA